MITVRNTFCAMMLASTVSLFAMDANKKKKHVNENERLIAAMLVGGAALIAFDTYKNEMLGKNVDRDDEVDEAEYQHADNLADAHARSEYKKEYARTQAEYALERAAIPANVTEQQCEKIVKKVGYEGGNSYYDLDGKDYDRDIAEALRDAARDKK